MPFVPPSGIREPSPRMALAPSRIDVTPRTGVLTHLCCRQSWSRSEPRTRGHKVWAMKSRLVARRNSSIEHRRTWVRSRNLHFLAEERQWLLKNSIGLRSTRSISHYSAPLRKAISRLRYLPTTDGQLVHSRELLRVGDRHGDRSAYRAADWIGCRAGEDSTQGGGR